MFSPVLDTRCWEGRAEAQDRVPTLWRANPSELSQRLGTALLRSKSKLLMGREKGP